jgi:hypothetical protein
MPLSPERIQAVAQQLMAQTTPEGILKIRRQLDDASAKQVIRALPPLERGALLMCIAFRSTDRWAPFDSAIIDGTLEDLIEQHGGGDSLPSA